MTTPLLPAFVGAPAVNRVYHTDALTLLRAMDAGSVDLIATDWPYNGVKDEAWDNQWATDADFLAWMGEHLAEMKRVLKPNGSYYGFASPRMAARVEVLTGEYFNVLNSIRWVKDAGWHNRTSKEEIRGYLQPWEAAIFAEQNASDSKYATLEYEINGQVFKPLKEWFRECVKVHNIGLSQLNAALGAATNGGGLASGYFGDKVEFQLPTKERYQQMQTAFPAAFNRTYADLRAEYETLRAEYETLRRPFTVSADVPYTDVWDFPTVGTYAGKHPCEKPLAMMRHIVEASSRPDALVLDCFCGSGNTLLAAKQLGRNYIGCDRDAHWSQVATNRLVTEFGKRKLITSNPVNDLPLFREAQTA